VRKRSDKRLLSRASSRFEGSLCNTQAVRNFALRDAVVKAGGALKKPQQAIAERVDKGAGARFLAAACEAGPEIA
jgi:hypothetical protein